MHSSNWDRWMEFSKKKSIWAIYSRVWKRIWLSLLRGVRMPKPTYLTGPIHHWEQKLMYPLPHHSVIDPTRIISQKLLLLLFSQLSFSLLCEECLSAVPCKKYKWLVANVLIFKTLYIFIFSSQQCSINKLAENLAGLNGIDCPESFYANDQNLKVWKALPNLSS